MLFWTTLFSSIGKFTGKLRQSSLMPLIIPFLLLILIGTVAYTKLEGWTLMNSLYATIITITTVGYGDLSPQTTSGRLFAIFFTIVAIGLTGYALSTAAATVFETHQYKKERKRLERRMKKISDLTGHVIICGGGMLGNRAAGEFKRRNIPFVIVESDEDRLKQTMLWMHEDYMAKRMRHYESLDVVDLTIEEQKNVAELAEETGILYLLEDPTDEQQLRSVGIDTAYGVVAAMDDDRDNTTIILSARDMGRRLNNQKLRIVASAKDEANIHTLYLAGADRVISPNMMGGVTLASQMLDHDAAEFWEHMLYRNNDSQMRFGDMRPGDHPEMIGRTVADVRQTLSQMIIAIRRDGEFIYAPNLDEIVNQEDVLIVIGPHLS